MFLLSRFRTFSRCPCFGGYTLSTASRKLGSPYPWYQAVSSCEQCDTLRASTALHCHSVLCAPFSVHWWPSHGLIFWDRAVAETLKQPLSLSCIQKRFASQRTMRHEQTYTFRNNSETYHRIRTNTRSRRSLKLRKDFIFDNSKTGRWGIRLRFPGQPGYGKYMCHGPSCLSCLLRWPNKGKFGRGDKLELSEINWENLRNFQNLQKANFLRDCVLWAARLCWRVNSRYSNLKPHQREDENVKENSLRVK